MSLPKDPYISICEEFSASFKQDLIDLKVFDESLKHHAKAFENCLKLLQVASDSVHVQNLWNGLIRSATNSLLNLKHQISKPCMREFASMIKPWLIDKQFRGLNHADLLNMYNLAVDGPWSKSPYKELIDGSITDAKKLAESFEHDPDCAHFRLRALLNSKRFKQLAIFGTAMLIHPKMKGNTEFENAFQLFANMSLSSKRIQDLMTYFNLNITMTVVDELLEENESAEKLCSAAMEYLWKNQEMNHIEEVTSKWCQVMHSEHGADDFFKLISERLKQQKCIIQSVEQCIILATALWKEIPDLSRYSCVEILHHALCLLAADSDNRSQIETGILSSIIYFVPNSQVARYCVLTIFVREPTVNHYFEVAKTYKTKFDRSKESLEKFEIRTRLLDHLQHQWPSEFLLSNNWDWMRLRKLCHETMTRDDAAYVQLVETEEAQKSLAAEIAVEASKNAVIPSKTMQEASLDSTDTSITEDSEHTKTDTSDSCDCLICNLKQSNGEKTPYNHIGACHLRNPTAATPKKPDNPTLPSSDKHAQWTCPEETCHRGFRSKTGISRHLNAIHSWSSAEIGVFFDSFDKSVQSQKTRLSRSDFLGKTTVLSEDNVLSVDNPAKSEETYTEVESTETEKPLGSSTPLEKSPHSSTKENGIMSNTVPTNSDKTNLMKNVSSMEAPKLSLPPIFPANHEPIKPDATQTVKEPPSKITVSNQLDIECPIESCTRTFRHRHTVQAHIEFRHKIDSKKAIVLAKNAKFVPAPPSSLLKNKNSSENATSSDADIVMARGWYWMVDEFLFQDAEQSLPGFQTLYRRQDTLKSSIARDVICLLGRAPDSYDFTAVQQTIKENWNLEMVPENLPPHEEQTTENFQDEEVNFFETDTFQFDHHEPEVEPPLVTRKLADIKSLLTMEVQLKSPQKQAQQATVNPVSSKRPLEVKNKLDSGKRDVACQTFFLPIEGNFGDRDHFHVLQKRLLDAKPPKSKVLSVAFTVKTGGLFLSVPTRTIPSQCCLEKNEADFKNNPSVKGRKYEYANTPPAAKKGSLQQKKAIPIAAKPMPVDGSKLQTGGKPKVKRKYDIQTIYQMAEKYKDMEADPNVSGDASNSSRSSFEDALNYSTSAVLLAERVKQKSRRKSSSSKIETKPPDPTTKGVQQQSELKSTDADAPQAKPKKMKKPKPSISKDINLKRNLPPQIDVSETVKRRRQEMADSAKQASANYQELLKQAEELNTKKKSQKEVASKTVVAKILPEKVSQEKMKKDVPLPPVKTPASVKGEDLGAAKAKASEKQALKSASKKRRISLRKLSSILKLDEETEAGLGADETAKLDDSVSMQSEDSLYSHSRSTSSSEANLDSSDYRSEGIVCAECKKRMKSAFALACHMRKRHKGHSKKVFFPGAEAVPSSDVSSSKTKRSKNELEPSDITEAGSNLTTAAEQVAHSNDNASQCSNEQFFADTEASSDSESMFPMLKGSPKMSENRFSRSWEEFESPRNERSWEDSMRDHSTPICSTSSESENLPQTDAIERSTPNRLTPPEAETDTIPSKEVLWIQNDRHHYCCLVLDCICAYIVKASLFSHFRRKHPGLRPCGSYKLTDSQRRRYVAMTANHIVRTSGKFDLACHAFATDSPKSESAGKKSKLKAERRTAYKHAAVQIQLGSSNPVAQKWGMARELSILYNKRANRRIAMALKPAPKRTMQKLVRCPSGSSESTESFEADYEAEYECWNCKEMFHTRTNLSKHIQSHLKLLSLISNRCDYNACLFAFNNEEELMAHKQLHFKRDSNICLFCPNASARFRSVRRLLIHESTGHPDLKVNMETLRRQFCIHPYKHQNIQKFLPVFTDANHEADHSHFESDEHFLADSRRRASGNNGEICSACQQPNVFSSVATPRCCGHAMVDEEVQDVLTDMIHAVKKYNKRMSKREKRLDRMLKATFNSNSEEALQQQDLEAPGSGKKLNLSPTVSIPDIRLSPVGSKEHKLLRRFSERQIHADQQTDSIPNTPKEGTLPHSEQRENGSKQGTPPSCVKSLNPVMDAQAVMQSPCFSDDGTVSSQPYAQDVEPEDHVISYVRNLNADFTGASIPSEEQSKHCIRLICESNHDSLQKDADVDESRSEAVLVQDSDNFKHVSSQEKMSSDSFDWPTVASSPQNVPGVETDKAPSVPASHNADFIAWTEHQGSPGQLAILPENMSNEIDGSDNDSKSTVTEHFSETFDASAKFNNTFDGLSDVSDSADMTAEGYEGADASAEPSDILMPSSVNEVDPNVSGEILNKLVQSPTKPDPSYTMIDGDAKAKEVPPAFLQRNTQFDVSETYDKTQDLSNASTQNEDELDVCQDGNADTTELPPASPQPSTKSDASIESNDFLTNFSSPHQRPEIQMDVSTEDKNQSSELPTPFDEPCTTQTNQPFAINEHAPVSPMALSDGKNQNTDAFNNSTETPASEVLSTVTQDVKSGSVGPSCTDANLEESPKVLSEVSEVMHKLLCDVEIEEQAQFLRLCGMVPTDIMYLSNADTSTGSGVSVHGYKAEAFMWLEIAEQVVSYYDTSEPTKVPELLKQAVPSIDTTLPEHKLTNSTIEDGNSKDLMPDTMVHENAQIERADTSQNGHASFPLLNKMLDNNTGVNNKTEEPVSLNGSEPLPSIVPEQGVVIPTTSDQQDCEVLAYSPVRHLPETKTAVQESNAPQVFHGSDDPKTAKLTLCNEPETDFAQKSYDVSAETTSDVQYSQLINQEILLPHSKEPIYNTEQDQQMNPVEESNQPLDHNQIPEQPTDPTQKPELSETSKQPVDENQDPRPSKDHSQQPEVPLDQFEQPQQPEDQIQHREQPSDITQQPEVQMHLVEKQTHLVGPYQHPEEPADRTKQPEVPMDQFEKPQHPEDQEEPTDHIQQSVVLHQPLDQIQKQPPHNYQQINHPQPPHLGSDFASARDMSLLSSHMLSMSVARNHPLWTVDANLTYSELVKHDLSTCPQLQQLLYCRYNVVVNPDLGYPVSLLSGVLTSYPAPSDDARSLAYSMIQAARTNVQTPEVQGLNEADGATVTEAANQTNESILDTSVTTSGEGTEETESSDTTDLDTSVQSNSIVAATEPTVDEPIPSTSVTEDSKREDDAPLSQDIKTEETVTKLESSATEDQDAQINSHCEPKKSEEKVASSLISGFMEDFKAELKSTNKSYRRAVVQDLPSMFHVRGRPKARLNTSGSYSVRRKPRSMAEIVALCDNLPALQEYQANTETDRKVPKLKVLKKKTKRVRKKPGSDSENLSFGAESNSSPMSDWCVADKVVTGRKRPRKQVLTKKKFKKQDLLVFKSKVTPTPDQQLIPVKKRMGRPPKVNGKTTAKKAKAEAKLKEKKNQAPVEKVKKKKKDKTLKLVPVLDRIKIPENSTANAAEISNRILLDHSYLKSESPPMHSTKGKTKKVKRKIYPIVPRLSASPALASTIPTSSITLTPASTQDTKPVQTSIFSSPLTSISPPDSAKAFSAATISTPTQTATITPLKSFGTFVSTTLPNPLDEFPCSMCEKTIKGTKHYITHLSVHHIFCKKKHSCKKAHCFRSFDTPEELYFHSLLHDTQGFPCLFCREWSPTLKDINAHIDSKHINLHAAWNSTLADITRRCGKRKQDYLVTSSTASLQSSLAQTSPSTSNNQELGFENSGQQIKTSTTSCQQQASKSKDVSSTQFNMPFRAISQVSVKTATNGTQTNNASVPGFGNTKKTQMQKLFVKQLPCNTATAQQSTTYSYNQPQTMSFDSSKSMLIMKPGVLTSSVPTNRKSPTKKVEPRESKHLTSMNAQAHLKKLFLEAQAMKSKSESPVLVTNGKTVLEKAVKFPECIVNRATPVQTVKLPINTVHGTQVSATPVQFDQTSHLPNVTTVSSVLGLSRNLPFVCSNLPQQNARQSKKMKSLAVVTPIMRSVPNSQHNIMMFQANTAPAVYTQSIPANMNRLNHQNVNQINVVGNSFRNISSRPQQPMETLPHQQETVRLSSQAYNRDQARFHFVQPAEASFNAVIQANVEIPLVNRSTPSQMDATVHTNPQGPFPQANQPVSMHHNVVQPQSMQQPERYSTTVLPRQRLKPMNQSFTFVQTPVTYQKQGQPTNISTVRQQPQFGVQSNVVNQNQTVHLKETGSTQGPKRVKCTQGPKTLSVPFNYRQIAQQLRGHDEVSQKLNEHLINQLEASVEKAQNQNQAQPSPTQYSTHTFVQCDIPEDEQTGSTSVRGEHSGSVPSVQVANDPQAQLGNTAKVRPTCTVGVVRGKSPGAPKRQLSTNAPVQAKRRRSDSAVRQQFAYMPTHDRNGRQLFIDLDKLGENRIDFLECEYCSNMYSKLADLQSHMKSDHYLHLCPTPQCGDVFGSEDSLAKHMREKHRQPIEYVRTEEIPEATESTAKPANSNDSANRENDEAGQDKATTNREIAAKVWNASKSRSDKEENRKRFEYYYIDHSSAGVPECDLLWCLFYEVKTFAERSSMRITEQGLQCKRCPIAQCPVLGGKKALYYHILEQHSLEKIYGFLQKRIQTSKRRRSFPVVNPEPIVIEDDDDDVLPNSSSLQNQSNPYSAGPSIKVEKKHSEKIGPFDRESSKYSAMAFSLLESRRESFEISCPEEEVDESSAEIEHPRCDDSSFSVDARPLQVIENVSACEEVESIDAVELIVDSPTEKIETSYECLVSDCTTILKTKSEIEIHMKTHNSVSWYHVQGTQVWPMYECTVDLTPCDDEAPSANDAKLVTSTADPESPTSPNDVTSPAEESEAFGASLCLVLEKCNTSDEPSL